MAESNSTLGKRFAESKFLAKSYNLYKTESFRPGLYSSLDENLKGSMETLRSHVNYMLTLPLSVREKSRLVRYYWELEFLVEEIRLMLDLRHNSP